MNAIADSSVGYLKFYKYLTDQEVTKLRNIAIGLSDIQSFSPQEIQLLETKLLLEQKN